MVLEPPAPQARFGGVGGVAAEAVGVAYLALRQEIALRSEEGVERQAPVNPRGWHRELRYHVWHYVAKGHELRTVVPLQ